MAGGWEEEQGLSGELDPLQSKTQRDEGVFLDVSQTLKILEARREVVLEHRSSAASNGQLRAVPALWLVITSS